MKTLSSLPFNASLYHYN